MYCLQINRIKNIVMLFFTISIMIPFFCKVSNAAEAHAINVYTLDDIQRAYQEYEQRESEILEKIGTFRPR